MSDDDYIPGPMSPDSPPARTGSHPITFVPAPFAVRPDPPYPVRHVDEMTTLMPPPIVEPRRDNSEPVTHPEMRAAGPHTQDDWGSPGWAHANEPQETIDIGPDRSWFALYGGREDPNETAAVPTANVMESIEVEGDPLIAIRQVRDDGQRVIRRELHERIELEERYDVIGRSNQYLEQLLEESDNNLAAAIRDRDWARNQAQRLQGELDAMPLHDQARVGANGNGDQEETSRVEDLERANHRLRHDRNVYRARAHQAERNENEMIEEALQSEREQNQLIEERNRLANRQLQLETERDHYQSERDLIAHDYAELEMGRDRYRIERDQERNQNQILQAQIQDLSNRLVASQTVARLPSQTPSPPPGSTHLVDSPPVVAPPITLPQPVAPPVAPAGPGRRGRGGRGRGGAVSRRSRGGRREAATREQPKRACKVVKNYRV